MFRIRMIANIRRDKLRQGMKVTETKLEPFPGMLFMSKREGQDSRFSNETRKGATIMLLFKMSFH